MTRVLETAAGNPEVAVVAVEKLKSVCQTATRNIDEPEASYIQVSSTEPENSPIAQPIVPPIPKSMKLETTQKSGRCQMPQTTQMMLEVAPREK
jgi:hypothetical protein